MPWECSCCASWRCVEWLSERWAKDAYLGIQPQAAGLKLVSSVSSSIFRGDPMSFHKKIERLVQMIRYPMRHVNLLIMLCKRDIKVRTSGTMLGIVWMVLQPALQIIALWFLLDIILKVKFPHLAGGFVAYFLVGMISWLLLSETMQRSLVVMSEYASLYQRSAFPVAILPLVPWLVMGAIYGAILFVVSMLIGGWRSSLGAIILVGILMIWLLPFCYLLAVVGLFVRDTRQLAPFLLNMLMYLTPILYTPDAFPEALSWWLLINPFAHLMTLNHALIQGFPWGLENILFPLLVWGIAIIPARRLFLRAEPHMREAL